jgi:serine/threonine protein kinase
MLKVDVAELTIGGNTTGTRAMFTVTELAVNGDLFGFVQKAGGLPEPVCRQYMSQLVSAMDFFHGKGLCHRDMKLENCFLN